jgi:hypothetical protein
MLPKGLKCKTIGLNNRMVFYLLKMKTEGKKESRKELKELLERETLFLEITRRLYGQVQNVFARPESLEKLAEKLKACETDIVKRYFFPVDKTIDAFTDKPSLAREELIKTSEEERRQLLIFIDMLDNELKNKEKELEEAKEELKKFREMLRL